MKKEMMKKFESGQAIILIAVAVVGLLGMTALAVDGSMVYSDRNSLQGTADNTVMSAAAAGAIELDKQGVFTMDYSCDDAGVIASMVAARDAAIARAATNGVELDADISDGNGVQVTCSVVKVEGYYDRYFDVAVKITNSTKTAFTKVLFPKGIANQVEAASRVRPRRTLANGNAIASLGSEHCNGGITMNGTVDVFVYDGGIYSNYCLQVMGNVDVNLIVDYGGISYVAFYTNTGNTSVNPTPQQVDESIPVVEIPTPDCASLTNYGAFSQTSAGSNGTINPGRFSSIKLSGGTLTMNPGLYCVSGAFTVSGSPTLKVAGDKDDTSGVTIYMPAGSMSLSGNAKILLRAPSVNQPPALKGMLLFAPLSNTNTMTITGNVNSFIRGTIYVPGAPIVVQGNGNAEGWYSELIGENVQLGGNANLVIHATSDFNYSRPPMVELLK
jgi:Putative Flp pilus-assembly TadE/G-like